MPASDSFETSLLTLMFVNTLITAFAGTSTGGDLPPSTSDQTLTFALHTATPGEAGTQLTNECDYTDYARTTVARGAAQWTVSGGTVDNDNAIAFVVAGATAADSVTFFSIGSGVSNVMHIYGAVVPTLVVNVGVTPSFAAGALDISVT